MLMVVVMIVVVLVVMLVLLIASGRCCLSRPASFAAARLFLSISVGFKSMPSSSHVNGPRRQCSAAPRTADASLSTLRVLLVQGQTRPDAPREPLQTRRSAVASGNNSNRTFHCTDLARLQHHHARIFVLVPLLAKRVIEVELRINRTIALSAGATTRIALIVGVKAVMRSPNLPLPDRATPPPAQYRADPASGEQKPRSPSAFPVSPHPAW